MKNAIQENLYGRSFLTTAGSVVQGKPCLYFGPQDPVHEIVEHMRQNHLNAAAVMESGDFTGLLTSRSILFRIAIAQSEANKSMGGLARSFNTLKASEVMIRSPATIDFETPVEAAMDIMMRNGHHHMPVMRESRLAGILNITDVVESLKEKTRKEIEGKDLLLSYFMNHENYGCQTDGAKPKM